MFRIETLRNDLKVESEKEMTRVLEQEKIQWQAEKVGLIVGQNIVLRFVLLSQGKREIVFKVAFGLHLQYTNSKNVLFVIYEKRVPFFINFPSYHIFIARF